MNTKEEVLARMVGKIPVCSGCGALIDKVKIERFQEGDAEIDHVHKIIKMPEYWDEPNDYIRRCPYCDDIIEDDLSGYRLQ